MELPKGYSQWLGATPLPEEKGTNFALFATPEARRVELCLFDRESGANESRHIDLHKDHQNPVYDGKKLKGYIWHGLVNGVAEGQLYGFRVHGEQVGDEWRHYNPNKLILDPAGKAATGTADMADPCHSPDNNDNNGKVAPKSRVVDWRALPPGHTQWLGATPDSKRGGTNFVFYTGKDATGVELCLFDKAKGEREKESYALRSREEVHDDHGKLIGYLWNGFAAGVNAGQLYGFRVHGPFDPSRRLFYNASKLLVDPCAKAVTHEIHQWEARHYPDNHVDNADIMPKARVVDWQDLHRQARSVGSLYAHADTNILEMHVKGATILHPDIPEKERGTYKALGSDAFINWVKDMHFTSVELLPVESFGTDPRLANLGLTNYWGYMPMAPMAPHTGYAATSRPELELAKAIRKLNNARRRGDPADKGIEVIMDVVPNHTLECGPDGPVINLRGMDDTLYQQGDYTGTGNTRDFGHPINRRMFLEELKYWHGLGVNGFRIDLATIIGREHGADFNPDSPMLHALRDDIRQDNILRNVKFYGEPWDLGPNGYQIGQLASNGHAKDAVSNDVAEWDGKGRDALKHAALNPDAHVPRNELVRRISGSSDLYSDPQHRVIKVGSHDDMTLDNFVTYKHKRNWANKEGNKDGNEGIANWGAEGPTDDPAINANRLRAQRFALALVAVSQGVSMTALGHERGKSQHGNSNAYCQDNEITHIPWGDGVRPEGHALMEFARMANQFRMKHMALRRAQHFNGLPDEASGLQFKGGFMKDVTWLDTGAGELKDAPMNQPGGFGMMLSGDPGNSAPETRNLTRIVQRKGRDSPLLVLINPTNDDINFTLPDVPGVQWKSALNSCEPGTINTEHGGNHTVKVGYRSLIAFEGQRELKKAVELTGQPAAALSI